VKEEEEEGGGKKKGTRRSGEENGIHQSGISESAIDIKECDHIALAIIISTHVVFFFFFFFFFCPPPQPKTETKTPAPCAMMAVGHFGTIMQCNATQHNSTLPCTTQNIPFWDFIDGMKLSPRGWMKLSVSGVIMVHSNGG